MTRETARIIVEQLDNYLSHTCQDYGERDHEAMTIAIKALEQESESICKYGILHKIAEFFQNWDGDETAKMEISVNDMREVADVYRRKARAERQLTEKALDYNPNEWCHDCSEYNHDKHCCPRYNKVIRSAVEEMKQTCEVAISRADALKLIRDCGRCDDKSAYGTIYHGIEHLPPVQPKIKTGHWILTDDDFVYCSECEDSYYPRPIDASWYYCPHCGAKMVEPQESEET